MPNDFRGYSNPNYPSADEADIYNPAIGKLNSLSGADGVGFFVEFIPKVVGLLLVLGSLFFFFMLLWGAISWIVSGGEKAALESAKGRITNAVIGMVLLLSTFAVVALVEYFFGINILTIDIGPLIIK